MKNKYIIFSLLLFITNNQIRALQSPYLEAYNEIDSMLSTNCSNFQEAVFLTENAYYDNQLEKDIFDGAISFYSAISKNIMTSGDITYTETDKDIVAIQCAVYLLMTDSIPVLAGGEIAIHPPFTYNHEDFAGQKDWSNMFVSKLMETNKGNCHSMPYLYKMIMDELGQESYLALAPNHIYIKANNKKVGWYNIELTCGDFPTDAWLMASGYIHLDAIRNGLYMEALNEKQSVCLTLVDLAQGYQAKFGIGDGSFILKCCDTALEHFPNYINAMLLKAETLTALYQQSGSESEEKKQLLSQMNELYTTIHKLGYRKMPKEMYQNWISSLNTQETNQRMKSIIVKDKF